MSKFQGETTKLFEQLTSNREVRCSGEDVTVRQVTMVPDSPQPLARALSAAQDIPSRLVEHCGSRTKLPPRKARGLPGPGRTTVVEHERAK